MRRLAFVLALGALALLAGRETAPGQSSGADDRAEPTFRVVELRIDAGDRALAAWQVELRFDERIAVVGLEAGTPGFSGDGPRPWHDPAGFRSGRLILADFVTDDERAPRGRVVAARIHLAIEDGADEPALDARLVTAAEPGGARFAPTVEITPTEGR